MSKIIEPVGILSPCPLCGSEAKFGYAYSWSKEDQMERKNIRNGISVSCTKCALQLGYQCNCPYDPGGDFTTFEEAAAAWNRRV